MNPGKGTQKRTQISNRPGPPTPAALVFGTPACVLDRPVPPLTVGAVNFLAYRCDWTGGEGFWNARRETDG
jgi:hypothetical protein